MKKLLISIPNYGSGSLHHLNRVINEFKSYKEFDVTVIVHTTVDLNIDEINVIKYPESIGMLLAFQHRHVFHQKANDFDLFLTCENDILIKEDTIKTFVKHDRILPQDTCLGFLRFEFKNDDYDNIYFLELNPWYGEPIKSKNIPIENSVYFEVANICQGCWLLSKEKLKVAMSSDSFLKEVANLEIAVCGIFKDWNGNIRKVLPQNIEDLQRCAIHHLSNKYINGHPLIHMENPPYTFTTLLNKLQMIESPHTLNDYNYEQNINYNSPP